MLHLFAYKALVTDTTYRIHKNNEFDITHLHNASKIPDYFCHPLKTVCYNSFYLRTVREMRGNVAQMTFLQKGQWREIHIVWFLIIFSYHWVPLSLSELSEEKIQTKLNCQHAKLPRNLNKSEGRFLNSSLLHAYTKIYRHKME